MAQTIETQLVVLGGGPGGYAAAFLAADRGIETTLIEARERPGGVCLHCGCIPSKALLHAAKLITNAQEADEWGLKFSTPEIDIDKLRTKKDKIVDVMSGHLAHVSKQKNINYIQARGTFADSQTLSLDNGDSVRFRNCIVATGSQPTKIPLFDIGSDRVMDSTSILELKDIPESLLVIGGGYIGLEMGSVYAALGTKVSVVEFMDALLPAVDADLVKPLHRRLKRNFDKIMLGTKVVKLEDTGNGVKATFEGPKVKEPEITYDRVLAAIGRRPNSKNIGLENTKVEVDEKGFVKVDKQRRTTDPNIFAIGDIAGEPMLAHKASHEGKLAVQVIAGDRGVEWDVRAIPAVVFTDPEIAWAGLMENDAKQEGREVKTAFFDWKPSGRATTRGRNDGITKLVVDPETDQVLGIGLCGEEAGEMIGEAVLAIEMGATSRDIAMSIHAHPTLTETVMEASESLHGMATHIY
ncbi:MAG: dihydrolipoyl dehydrogenase [Gemmataceae bacterium]